MHKKLITRTLAASWMAVGLLYAGNSSASTIACNDGPLSADITDKVNPNEGCLILEPLNANDNDSVSPPASSFTVNQETFFGHDDWFFDGKYDELSGSPEDKCLSESQHVFRAKTGPDFTDCLFELFRRERLEREPFVFHLTP
ncbi:MAG: hypothetical protein Kow0060_15470 [Methylohalobius crimeensis]